MSTKKTNINLDFANILRKIDGKSIARKELIQLAMQVNHFNEVEALNFVGRHVHQLKKKGLISSEGQRNSTRYVFGEALIDMLADPVQTQKEKSYKSEAASCASSLQHEKDKLSAELKLTIGEVEAFQDYLAKFPEVKKVIVDLLYEARDSAAQLYGRLNAIQKIIDATSAKGV